MIEFRVLGVPAPQGSKTRMPNGALLEAGSQTGRQKVSNEQIVDAYSRTGSVWKAGKELGICGQSVHERLAAIGYKMPGRKWTDDEKDELVRLIANQVTAGEAARRLGRTFAAVTCMLNEIGVTGYKAKQPKKLPRGAGYDKASMARHLKAIEDSGVPATRYCRSHGINIDNFVQTSGGSVPVPATAALALLGLGAISRRTRARPSALRPKALAPSAREIVGRFVRKERSPFRWPDHRG